MSFLDEATLLEPKEQENQTFTEEKPAFRIEIVRKIEDIPIQEWNGIFPDVLENYHFLKTLDESGFDQFSFYYVLVYDNSTLVGAAPCFLMSYSLDTTVQGPLKNIADAVKKFFPSLFTLRALICGYPTGQGHLGIRGDFNRVFEAILSGMERIASDGKVPFIAFKDFSSADAERLYRLQQKGFYKFESFPSTEMDIRFKSFDHYLSTLSGATRYDLRRKFKKVDGHVNIDMEVTGSLNEAIDDAFGLYLQTEARADNHFEKIPKTFFKKVAENMPGETKYFLWRINGKLVAFTFCLVSGEHLTDYYLGLDYSVAHQYHLFFVKFRDIMTWCLENKIKKYEMGSAGYEPKKRLDFKLIPLYAYAKCRNKWINPLLKIPVALLKPANFEEALMNKKEKLRDQKKLTLKVFLAILLCDVFDSLAQLLMKKGLPRTGIRLINFQSVADFFSHHASSPFLHLGLLVYASNFFIWMMILSKVDLSIALPMGGSSYALIPLLAIIFLHESVIPLRWLGIALIVLGIYFVSKSGRLTPSNPRPL